MLSNFSAYLWTRVFIVWFKFILYIAAIQWRDSFPFQFCSLTSGRASCKWYCDSYQFLSTGSQFCMHPVCHSDGLFVSTGCRTPSAVPTHACTPVVLSPYLGIPWKKHLAISDMQWHCFECVFWIMLSPHKRIQLSQQYCLYRRHLHGIMEP